jgi:hypothetical protein
VATFTYADLIEWSIHIPEWQRDALRRVLDHAEITNTDIAELAQLAKGPYSAPEARGPAAVPASADQVWPSSAALPDVRLLAVREMDGGRRAAAGDRRVAAEAVSFARRWPTSGESDEGSLLGSGIYWGRRARRKRSVRRILSVTVSVYC